MGLRHLRYFVVVGEEQHYGRASRRLGVAQPALSRQIQDLEEELGFKLFDRLPRGVKLSAAGRLYLEDARRILQQVPPVSGQARGSKLLTPECPAGMFVSSHPQSEPSDSVSPGPRRFRSCSAY